MQLYSTYGDLIISGYSDGENIYTGCYVNVYETCGAENCCFTINEKIEDIGINEYDVIYIFQREG